MADSVESSPFWVRKSLTELTDSEWESLCDGCGKCCLHKLEDDESGELLFTAVACRLLDGDTCRCRDYAHRKARVPDCLTLRASDLEQLKWLPATCAYRLLYEGEGLPPWHHLVSGSRETVHEAHVSVRHRVISEEDVNDEDWDLYIIDNL